MIDRPLVVLDLEGDRATGAIRYGDDTSSEEPALPTRPSAAFDALVARYPEALLAWRDESAGAALSPVATWPGFLRNDLEVRHGAHLHRHDPVRSSIGAAHFSSPYVLPPPADRPFATWLLSPVAGIAAAATLAQAGPLTPRCPFPSALAILGHALSQRGAILWSEPSLGAAQGALPRQMSEREAALVVRHTLRRRFLPLWLVARGFDRRFPLAAFLAAAATRPHRPAPAGFAAQQRPRPATRQVKVDAVIPTLGRRDQLVRVLDELAAQDHPPHRVIIVEQVLPGDRDPGPLLPHPDLDVDHVVLDRPGAGNARNVGLARASSPWVVLVDDDVSVGPDYIDRLLEIAVDLEADAVVAGHDDPTGASSDDIPVMWHHFGSGEVLVARAWFDRVGGFDRRLDGGYGEDYEWGMRARRAGALVVRAQGPLLRHLHTTTGGLRRTYPHPWHETDDRPVPSPTVILSHRLWETDPMRVGRTVHYWLRVLARERGRKPVTRIRRWRASQRWAEHLHQSATSEEATHLGP